MIFIEKFALYDPIDKQVIQLEDTVEKIKEAYKMSKIFRKMVNQKPLEMVKVSLTEEEYEKFMDEGNFYLK